MPRHIKAYYVVSILAVSVAMVVVVLPWLGGAIFTPSEQSFAAFGVSGLLEMLLVGLLIDIWHFRGPRPGRPHRTRRSMPHAIGFLLMWALFVETTHTPLQLFALALGSGSILMACGPVSGAAMDVFSPEYGEL